MGALEEAEAFLEKKDRKMAEYRLKKAARYEKEGRYDKAISEYNVIKLYLEGKGPTYLTVKKKIEENWLKEEEQNREYDLRKAKNAERAGNYEESAKIYEKIGGSMHLDHAKELREQIKEANRPVFKADIDQRDYSSHVSTDIKDSVVQRSNIGSPRRLSNEEILRALDERLALGEITELTYYKLKRKYRKRNISED